MALRCRVTYRSSAKISQVTSAIRQLQSEGVVRQRRRKPYVASSPVTNENCPPQFGPKATLRIARFSCRWPCRRMSSVMPTFYRRIFNSIPTAIAVCSTDGKLIDANHMAIDMVRLTRQELIGTKIWDWSNWSHTSGVREQLKHAVTQAAKGMKSQIDSDLSNPDSSTAEIQWTVAPVLSDEAPNEVSHIVVTAVDITDRSRAESRVRLLQQELAHVGRLSTLGQMSTSIAHELNQPLAAIASYCFAAREQLRHSGPNHHAVNESLEKIELQAVRAGDVIRRLRRMVSKSQSLRSTVCVSDLVSEVLEIVEPDLRLARITCQVETTSALVPVIVDRVEIQQVLINLLRNAIEAVAPLADEHRAIRISFGMVSDNQVEVRIRDFGPGVHPSVRERLFEPFQTTKNDGLGVGLAISRDIVSSHGGILELTPHNERGAEFRMVLPTSGKQDPGHE